MVRETFPVEMPIEGKDRLTKTLDQTGRALGKLDGRVDRFNKGTKRLSRNTRKAETRLDRMGRAASRAGRRLALGLGAAIAAAGTIGVRRFIDFEKGLVGVGKTADIEGKALQRLGRRVQEMSLRMPESATSLLELAQAAGQLGVKGEKNILKFTETMSKLATATDVVGAQGAQTLAVFLNILEGGVGNIDRVSAALVDLGNNANATENQILGVASEVSKALASTKRTTAGVLGLATTYKELGVAAEVGRTATLKTVDALKVLIEKGGKPLKAISALAGVTAKQFSETLKKDSVEGIALFVKALGTAQKRGIDVDKVLAKMGLSEIRARTALKALSSQSEKLATNLDRAGKAFKENTALEEEFGKAAETTGARLQMSMNRLDRAATKLGRALAPSVRFIADITDAAVDMFEKPEEAFKNSSWWRAFMSLNQFIAGVSGEGQKNLETAAASARIGRETAAKKAEKAGDEKLLAKLRAKETVRQQQKQFALSFGSLFKPKPGVERIRQLKDEVKLGKLDREMLGLQERKMKDERTVKRIEEIKKQKQEITIRLENVPRDAKVTTEGDTGKELKIEIIRGMQGASLGIL